MPAICKRSVLVQSPIITLGVSSFFILRLAFASLSPSSLADCRAAFARSLLDYLSLSLSLSGFSLSVEPDDRARQQEETECPTAGRAEGREMESPGAREEIATDITRRRAREYGVTYR